MASSMRTPAATVNKQHSTRNHCRRCSGHMDYDLCIDLESDSGQSTFWVLRCLQCGDLVDEVILRHRSLSNPETLSVAAA